MNETLRTIHGLRTTRAGEFSDKEINDEDVQTIIKASIRAANASARQSYSIIVVDDDVKMQLSWPGKKVLLFCVDFTRLVDTAKHLQFEFDVEYLMQFLTGVIDTSLAVQTAVVAAQSLGIGSLITNRVYHHDLEKVYQLLGLPTKHCFPLIAVCLGYPAQEPEYIKGRLDGVGVVHQGKYHRLTELEKERVIKAYDAPENHLGLTDNWRKQGFEHYLEWFYKKWCTQIGNRETAQEFNAVLKAQGFLDDIV